MTKKIFRLFLIVIIFCVSNQKTSAQCAVQAYATSDTICYGEPVYLYAIGSCGNIRKASFNELNIPTGWTYCCNPILGTTCGPSLDNSPYLWFGQNSWFQERYLQTDTFLIDTIGCHVFFNMKYGDAQASINCDNPDMANEGIHLQYSINNGNTWTEINYWEPLPTISGPLYTWTTYAEALPDSMIDHVGLLRWRQDTSSGADEDHWGLDNINIICPEASIVIWSSGDTGFYPGAKFPLADTFYIATIKDTVNNNYASDTVFITVLPPVSAEFLIDSSACEDKEVIINYIGNASLTANYDWNFNGGTVISGSGQGPYQIMWKNPGNYQVSLKVNELKCHSPLKTKDIFIKPKPMLTFYTATYSGCQPLSVNYYNISPTQGISCYWNFGDGYSSNLDNPNHIYTTPGNFDLTFIGVAQNGCSDTLSFKGFTKVYPKPFADFTADKFNVSIQNPEVHFTDLSSADVVNFFWDFDDGHQSTLTNPVHVFDKMGAFDITHLVANAYNCKDTIVKQILVTLTDVNNVTDEQAVINIFGNHGKIDLRITGLSGNFHLAIYNSALQKLASNELVLNQQVEFYQSIDIPCVTEGIYILHLWNEEKSILKKFMLN